MKLDFDFKELARLRRQMGATNSSWSPSSKELDPRDEIRIQLGAGIEISLEEVDQGPGGLLTYKGEQVILYIKDTQTDQSTLENEPEKSRRFHVAECDTLEKMRQKGRFERYVVTNRMDGKFLVDWFDRDSGNRGETEAELKVCKNCLKTLNWRGYEQPADRLQLKNGSKQAKSAIWSEFGISQFLLEFSTFFHSKPSRRDRTAKLNEYAAHWPAISERMRRSKKWTCEECGVDLSSAPQLLHCHHKNGVVTDNRQDNLQVLCEIDHAKQPNHGHMKVANRDKKTIEDLLAEQQRTQN